MRTVTIAVRTSIARDLAWCWLTDVAAFPGRVRFVRRVRLHGPLAAGTRWDDQTTILFAPVWVRHTITRVDPPRAFAFAVHLPFGASMTQAYTIEGEESAATLHGTVRFRLPTGIDVVLGRLLERRLTIMLATSCAAAQRAASAGAAGTSTAGSRTARRRCRRACSTAGHSDAG
jgi:hypothetical protein